MEPPVSEPSAARHRSAATAAAEPPEEPPGTYSRFQGLRVGPKAEFSVEEPMANSSMLVLPRNTAPGLAQAGHHRGVVGRHKIFQDPGGAGGAEPPGDHDVFQGQGNAGERVAFPRARRASASRAWARAPASSTVR